MNRTIETLGPCAECGARAGAECIGERGAPMGHAVHAYPGRATLGPVDRERFAAWLRERAKERREAGPPRNAEACPLACHLSETLGAAVLVGPNRYRFTGSDHWRALPLWAVIFARAIDSRINSFPVSAEAALATLGDVPQDIES